VGEQLTRSVIGVPKRRRVGAQRGEPRVLLVEQGGRGGVADYTRALAQALVQLGWQVDCATATDHRYGALPGLRIHGVFFYTRDRGALSRAARRLRLSRPINGLAYLAALPWLAMLARRADVVHVQGGEWPPLSVVTTLALRVAGRVPVYTPHNTFDRGRAYGRWRGVQYRLAARVIVHAQADLRALPHGTRAKAAVIPHGEYGLLASAGGRPNRAVERRALGLRDGEVAALLFGQLREDKGVRDLLLAAREVDGLCAILAGEDLGALSACSDLLSDNRVVVREGYQSLEAAARVFAASDIVAFPYRRASASGVLLLSYAFGRPVVIYPVGGLPEFVEDGETGWVCPRADPGALRDTLAAVVAAGPVERERRGRSGATLARTRFSWDAIARRTSELYRVVIGSA
jgi:glycosyltransferase involved in cell wall biosynthesis